MYKEVAIDPRCMADMEYYNLVKQHFGYDKGRYISAEVKVWTKEAMEYVKKSDLSDVKLQSVKNYLRNNFNIAANRLFVTGMGESQSLPGVDPFAAANRRVQFRKAN